MLLLRPAAAAGVVAALNGLLDTPCVQTQNLMMTMLLVSAPIILVMGVLSAFVANANQAQLMW
jgi:hypothetical protein